jgi:hypothetical protein
MWEQDYLLNLAESTAFAGVTISTLSSLIGIIISSYKYYYYYYHSVRTNCFYNLTSFIPHVAPYLYYSSYSRRVRQQAKFGDWLPSVSQEISLLTWKFSTLPSHRSLVPVSNTIFCGRYSQRERWTGHPRRKKFMLLSSTIQRPFIF